MLENKSAKQEPKTEIQWTGRLVLSFKREDKWKENKISVIIPDK